VRWVAGLALWFVVGVVYSINQLGNKTRCYHSWWERAVDFVLWLPVMPLVYVISWILWLYRKPAEPVICASVTPESLGIPKKGNYVTQIRVNGEKGKSWTVNVWSTEPVSVEVL
jgi:hypothetical protein